MDTLTTPQRKNFRCIFNSYVSEYNKDGVVRSIISQFEGYFANPEVTVTNDGFILTLTLGDNLSPTSVRDKILWNQFIESVTAADAIRKIQIIRLPKASEENEGSVGAFGPNGSDSGVDEKLNIYLDQNPQYTIGPNEDGSLGWHASIHYADPTGDLLPTIYGPGVEDGKPVDEFVNSDLTNMDDKGDALDGGATNNHAKLFMGFKVIAIDSDTGGAFTLNKPNSFQDVNEPPDQGPLHERANPATGIGGGAPISGASWYVTQPGNEQGTELGIERNRGDASSAPFGNISLSSKEEQQSFPGPSAATFAVLGIDDEEDPTHAMGGIATGSLNFGLNEYYDYEGEIDDNYF